ncbi:MAG TPA: hypothetical protein PKO15_01590 [Fibrobacteria bacterium]|nr:hypothetical protein [Fibrobacteria bacterium]HOX49945.1 hypothetical protein [Fibrobacteria bacterium]
MSILAILLSGLSSGAILQPPLALDDPSIALVSRLALAHDCRLPSQRPWPGESVLSCLERIQSDSGLTEGDRARARALALRLSPDSIGWRLLSWGSEGDRVGLDFGATLHLQASADPTLADIGSRDTLDGDFRMGLRVRPRVDVLLGKDLALWARPLQIVEFSPDKRWRKRSDPDVGVYQTALFVPVGEASRGRTTDWLEGAVESRGAWGRAWAGVSTPRWGSLPLEPLMFSGNALPLPGAQVTKSIGPLEATLLFARPIGSTWSEDRAVYAHRWGANGRTWSVGFSEMAITVERGLQPLYLVPVFPYMMAEHVLGDPDNKQMDFDATWRPAPGLELSAELFLDDLQNYLGFFSSGWGNKWGLGLGLAAADMLGQGSLDQLQATRMEPWAGTPSSAVLPGKPSNAPVHFGKPLGWADGPNSAALQWRHSQDLSERWSWTSQIRASWKGADTGSSFLDRNWHDSSGTWAVARTTKSWLDGALFRRLQVEAGIERRFARAARSQAAVGFAILDRPGRSAEFSPSFQWGISWNE